MMNDERMHVSVLTIDTPSQAPCTAAQRSTPASGSSLAAGAPRCEPSADRLCGGLAGVRFCLREETLLLRCLPAGGATMRTPGAGPGICLARTCTARSAGFQPAVSRISNPQWRPRANVRPTRSRRYSRLEICVTSVSLCPCVLSRSAWQSSG